MPNPALTVCYLIGEHVPLMQGKLDKPPFGIIYCMEPLSFGREDEKAEKKMRILELIIRRYLDIIEKNESKSAQELKAMVNPSDPAIQKLKLEITDNFHPYLQKIHQLDALTQVLERLRKIEDIEYLVPFWLQFSEIMALGACDKLEKAILLCTMLRAFEFDSLIIVTREDPWVTADNGIKSQLIKVPALVAMPLGNDAKNRKNEAGEVIEIAPEILKTATDKVLYCFNDNTYIDMQPE